MNSSLVAGTDIASETSPPSVLLRVLAAISFCHLLNDMVQALLPSIYPILKSSFHLNFGQIGILTLGVTGPRATHWWQPFIDELRELHYVEGNNLLITYLGADAQPERLPALAADLVKLLCRPSATQHG